MNLSNVWFRLKRDDRPRQKQWYKEEGQEQVLCFLSEIFGSSAFFGYIVLCEAFALAVIYIQKFDSLPCDTFSPRLRHVFVKLLNITNIFLPEARLKFFERGLSVDGFWTLTEEKRIHAR